MKSDLTGAWLSTYTYFSTSRGAEFQDRHYVTLTHLDSTSVRGRSVVEESNSQLILRLTVADRIVTGTWTERTSPTGYYRGATYHGAIQLTLSARGDSMVGKWVGFGKDQEIKTGEWSLVRLAGKQVTPFTEQLQEGNSNG